MPSSPAGTDPNPERFRELMVADEPTFADLMECVFSITQPVAEVYNHVLVEEECTANDLAETLDCDKSSVNRKLNRLHEQGLVTRRRSLLNVGGFTYTYEPVPVHRVQALMHETLDEWTAFMHQQIERVEKPLELPT